LALTAGWVGAVTAAAALRTWWRLGLSRRTASPEEALRGVRLTVAGVGLAWGFGAAAAIPALGLDQAALILVVLAGIVAGATGTLVGDRRSFHYLLLTALAPLPIGILLHGHSRAHLIATLLIVLFVGGMDRVHRRAYRTFVERVRAAVLLASSTQDLARQHAYLDALIARTPVAIAVLDSRRREGRPRRRARRAVRGHQRSQGGRTGHARGPRAGGAGRPSAQCLPRQHEPRDPHADERRARLRRAGAGHGAAGRAAPRAGAGALVLGGVDHHPERHPRIFEDRSRASGARIESVH